MCYVLNSDGQVQHYCDDESFKMIKCTLNCLNKHKYKTNLIAFNDVLDEFYKNTYSETTINKLFKVIETLVLSILNDTSFNRLEKRSINKLFKIITEKTKEGGHYTIDDSSTLPNFENIIIEWVNINHKYRHGKPNQQNKNVPAPLFVLIFSIGVSIFRFLLECDDEYQFIHFIKS